MPAVLFVALWNGKDPILKERLFGLSNPEGNHGEDVKEAYFYLDSTPTHSYCKALYKYPQSAFPYQQLVEENARRGKTEPEFELADTGVFDAGRYFDVFVEYAKGGQDDTLVRLTIVNRGPVPADLHCVPTLWFRNSWSWGCTHEGCTLKPRLSRQSDGLVLAEHETLQNFHFHIPPLDGKSPELLFTDNETNNQRVFGSENPVPYVKDAFDERIVHGNKNAVSPRGYGTKLGAWYQLKFPARRAEGFEISPDGSEGWLSIRCGLRSHFRPAHRRSQ